MTIELDGTVAEVLNDDPLVVKNQKNWYHAHAYGGWGKFFRGLRDKKLLATRCTNPECSEKRLWLPPRCECPDCWHDMEWVEAPMVGKVYSHTEILYPGAPFRASIPCPLISVEIEGGQAGDRHADQGRVQHRETNEYDPRSGLGPGISSGWRLRRH